MQEIISFYSSFCFRFYFCLHFSVCTKSRLHFLKAITHMILKTNHSHQEVLSHKIPKAKHPCGLLGSVTGSLVQPSEMQGDTLLSCKSANGGVVISGMKRGDAVQKSVPQTQNALFLRWLIF